MIIKHKKYYTSFLAIIFMAFISACDNEDFDDVTTEELTVKPGLLAGTWTFSEVVQVDQDAVDNGFPSNVQRLDITGFYNWSETTLTFDLDAQGNPSAFTINAGSAPNYLVPSGEWAVNHPVFTSEIMLGDGTATDSESRLVIEKITANQLNARIERISTDDVVFIRYDVVFTK